jgi:hypothetical protein
MIHGLKLVNFDGYVSKHRLFTCGDREDHSVYHLTPYCRIRGCLRTQDAIHSPNSAQRVDDFEHDFRHSLDSALTPPAYGLRKAWGR